MPSFRIVIAAIITLCLQALVGLNIAISQTGPDPIIAIAQKSDETILRTYSRTGQAVSEITLTPEQTYKIIYGRWSLSSDILALAKTGKTFTARIFDSAGALLNEFTTPEGDINTIYSTDLDNSGFDDLVVIQHINNRARAVIYYNPGQLSTSPTLISLPVLGLYYSPAIAGTTTVGFLVYNPAGAQVSAARSKSKRKKKNKGNKKTPKPKKPSKNGEVYLLDTQGNLVTTYAISRSLDGQILPFSSDGACGFAIREGTALRVYDHSGTMIKEHTVPLTSNPGIGDYSGSGLTNEFLLSEGTRLRFINGVTGTPTYTDLEGFPDQTQLIQDEINKLRTELISKFRGGSSLDELTKIRDQITELEEEKKSLTNASNLALSVSRLFTGGAGAIEGVCDVVFENPQDGYGGFLAKNGDFNGKAVYLTPGGKLYVNAELLKFGSYKVMTKLTDSGYGNPDRNGIRKHFRGKVPITSLGKHIFRAEYKVSSFSQIEEKHCWFIKKPAARID